MAIRHAQAGSPAERAGLRAGDVMTRLDGAPVTGVDDISRILDHERIGRAITVALLRGEELIELEVHPDERVD